MSTHTFTNSAGDKFELYPLNPLEEQVIRNQLEAEWKAAGRALPEPPFYEATNAAGESVKIQLTRLEDADTPELKEAWQAYINARSQFENEFGTRTINSLFASIVANPDDYPLWKRRMKMLKVDIPEDEADKQILFGQTWVIRSGEDLSRLFIAAYRTVGNLSEETAQAAEAMFRSRMEEAYSAAFDRSA